jgi:sec-independent protein translocase protein TatB
MLNIGLWELLVIVVAGLVFVGPERLPNVMRFLGRSYAKVRHASRDLRMAFQQEVDRVDNERRAEEISRRREALRQRRLQEESVTVAALDPHSPPPAPAPVSPSAQEGGEE